MDTLDKLLSKSELAFLAQHKIPLSRVIDARGLSMSERRATMHHVHAQLAIGAPCREQRHQLRTSAGHCVMCDPKKIAFAQRHRVPGQIYIARSEILVLTKIGSAGDARARIAQLNCERYGGAHDWKLVEQYSCAEAGRSESDVHRALSQYATKGRYQKDGKLTDCYELFDCPAEVAVFIVRDVLGIA